MTGWHDKIATLDDFDAARTKINFYITLGVLIVMAIVFPIRLRISPMNFVNLVHIGLSFFLLNASLILNFKNPKNKLSGYLTLISIFTIIASAAVYFGGLRTPGVTLLLIMPLSASFLIDKKASLVFFFLNFIFLASIYYCSSKGILPDTSPIILNKENQIRFIVFTGVLTLSFGIGIIAENIPKRVIYELKEIYESHPSGIAKINRNGEILYSNSAFKKIFEAKEFKNIDRISHLFKTGHLDLCTIRDSKEANQLELLNGNTLQISFKKMSSHKGNGLLFFSDVTLFVRKNELEKIVAEKNAKAVMVATYNHEINNPLMIAMAYARKIDQNMTEATVGIPKISKALKRIEEVVKEIDSINQQKS
jgi:PAS domain-containing protein